MQGRFWITVGTAALAAYLGMKAVSPREQAAHISPTAHYTGFTWFKYGLSHPAFATTEGRVMHFAAAPIHALTRLTGWGTLQGMLQARHASIDTLLEQAIAVGTVGTVIEVRELSVQGWIAGGLTDAASSLRFGASSSVGSGGPLPARLEF